MGKKIFLNLIFLLFTFSLKSMESASCNIGIDIRSNSFVELLGRAVEENRPEAISMVLKYLRKAKNIDENFLSLIALISLRNERFDIFEILVNDIRTNLDRVFEKISFIGHFLMKIDFEDRNKFEIYHKLLKKLILKKCHFYHSKPLLLNLRYDEGKNDIGLFFINEVINKKFNFNFPSEEVFERIKFIFLELLNFYKEGFNLLNTYSGATLNANFRCFLDELNCEVHGDMFFDVVEKRRNYNGFCCPCVIS